MDLSNISRGEVKVVDDDAATVLAETIAQYEADSGKTLQPAHIDRLLINTFAYREALARQQVNEAYRQQHPRFATGLMLDICGDDINTPRLGASVALTTIRFSAALSGSDTVDIPKGTEVSVGDVAFATSIAGTLSAAVKQIDLPAVCMQEGVAGNGWAIGQINKLSAPLHLTAEVKAANINIPTGGAEEESDDAYRERIMLAPESFSVAGSIGSYQYFARSVSPAIVAVHVGNKLDSSGLPIGGTVVLTVLTQDGLPGAELLAEVLKAVSGERVRPLCDMVTAQAPAIVDYSVNAELTVFAGANRAEVIAAAKAAWAAVDAANIKKLGADIVPLDIQTALKVDGVYNVVLKSPVLTEVPPDKWARCTAVNIVIKGEADG